MRLRTGFCTIVAAGALGWVGHVPAPLAAQADAMAIDFGPTLSWQAAAPIGPADVTAIDGDAAHPGTFYAGTRGGGLWKTTDFGTTWHPVFDAPPAGDVTAVRVAPSDGSILYVGVRDLALLHQSTDAGLTWQSRDLPGEPSRIDVDEHDPDRLFVSLAADGDQGGAVASIDGGRTWRSAASREPSLPAASVAVASPLPRVFSDEDGPLVWTHPDAPDTVMVAGRLGVSITVNGGRSWSRADALPAAGVGRLHVVESFPYGVCVARGTSTLCGTPWETPNGQDWYRLPPEVLSPVITDPREPEVVFGGNLVRFDGRTGALVDVSPNGFAPAGDETGVPKAFSADGRTLFVAADRVFSSSDGGRTWTPVSPDFSAVAGGPPRTIAALALSPIDGRAIWVGLDDGSLRLTRNGGVSWSPVSLPGSIRPVASIVPSRFDPESVYVVAGTGPSRLFRSRDGGGSWDELGRGIGAPGVHVVREDPFRRGLLFAGTGHSIVVSFDDGEHWQPFGLDLPSTPVHDLVIKDADLIAGTGGRGVWTLRDMSPLRQLTADVAAAPFFLFRPQTAWRLRASASPGASEGPGAAFTYLLGGDGAGDVSLEIVESRTGELIRRWSSGADGLDDGRPVEPRRLPTAPGLHRVNWDLRYSPPVPGADTRGTRVLPGIYQVRLTVDGRMMRQAVSVRMDPRVRTSLVDLTAQRDLGRALDAARAAVVAGRTREPVGGTEPPPLATASQELERLARAIEQADARPAAHLESAVEAATARVGRLLAGDAF